MIINPLNTKIFVPFPPIFGRRLVSLLETLNPSIWFPLIAGTSPLASKVTFLLASSVTAIVTFQYPVGFKYPFGAFVSLRKYSPCFNRLKSTIPSSDDTTGQVVGNDQKGSITIHKYKMPDAENAFESNTENAVVIVPNNITAARAIVVIYFKIFPIILSSFSFESKI